MQYRAFWERPALQKAGRVARRIGDLFPFTPIGLVSLAAACFALVVFGIGRVDLLLLVVGALGLFAGALALVTTLVTVFALRISIARREPGPKLVLSCDVPARTGFSLPRFAFVPLSTIEWSWLDPLAEVRVVREHGRLVEEVVPRGRAERARVVRRVLVGDALGLVRVAFRVVEEREISCLPSVGALGRVELLRSITGGEETYDPLGVPEGERVDTRAYAPGDPARLILWKAYARSRQLRVRTPERALSAARRTVAYLVAGDGDEPAAGVVRAALERGAFGTEWVLGADGPGADATEKRAALDRVVRSADVAEEERGAGLAPFLARARRGGSALRAVVFVPARRGAWLERMLAAARGPGVNAFEIVVCTDGIARPPAASWLKRLFFRRPSEEASRVRASEIAEVLRVLRPLAHARVLLVDRAAGRVYAEAHQRALLAEAEGTKA